jgi:6-phosphogluconolactonase (cycloisomerase 2 family)
VSAFSVNPNAKVKSITGSPFADQQTAPCWVEISHDGRYLFTVNTGSTTISRYRILANGTLSLIGSTPFSSGTGIAAFDARLDAAGTHLYVVDSAIASVSGFAVNGGSLSELSSSPASLPTGATPFGVTIVSA